MTDKSFGDSTYRGIKRNPLLSTAVTGLSIEDLTHNAVLLPVSSIVEPVVRQDNVTETQNIALDQSAQLAIPNLPSGDATAHFSNISHVRQFDLDNFTNIETSSQSKASHESKSNDFDVNEYIARLQCSRYVSAPLNSLLNEDDNANLEATEGNLEEINLNDTDKTPTENIVEVSQSLTADIAQNFSQLPTVLPQVASAVFSSFSHMLNLKSKEPTHDEAKTHYNNPAVNRLGEANVSFSAFPSNDVTRDIGPPPKEPPTISATAAGSYRISTKKKYAQIPGLITNDTPAMTNPLPHFQNNPTVPLCFVPPSLPDNEFTLKDDQTQSPYSEHVSQPSNIFAPITKDISEPQITETINSSSNFYLPETSTMLSEEIIPHAHSDTLKQNPPLLPPPPMFLNPPTQFDNSSLKKSIVPPSVARRISSNQPLIKPPAQHKIFTPFGNNILIPASTSESQPDIILNNASLTSASFISNTSEPADTNIQSSSNILTGTLSNETKILTDYSVPATYYENQYSSSSQDPSLFSSDKQNPDTFSIPQPTSQIFMTNIPSIDQSRNRPQTQMAEPQTQMTEPPKALSSSNFRLNKKKPKYYSGPIEGMGAVVNNIKPFNAESVSDYQGSLFTPKAPQEIFPGPSISDSNIEQNYAPFDISKPQNLNPLPGSHDVNPTKEKYFMNVDYNNTFDLSRKTTEAYDSSKDETKGFGIIGSLKSKLGSLDITKIQNSVSTFFDPTFNHESSSLNAYEYNKPTETENSTNNFQIFVPNELNSCKINNDIQPPIFTNQYLEPNVNVPYQDNSHFITSNNTGSSSYQPYLYNMSNYKDTNEPLKENIMSVKSEVGLFKEKNSSEVLDTKIQSLEHDAQDETSLPDILQNTVTEKISNFNIEEKLIEETACEQNPPSEMTIASKTEIFRKSPCDSKYFRHPITELNNETEQIFKNTTLNEKLRNFENSSSVSFFDSNTFGSEKNFAESIQEHDKLSDLNICETCREIEPENDEKELGSVTAQLIKNITSPFQLSNPVEAPLSESPSLERDVLEFDTDQCAEISHITEETIETIQIQSASELLEDIEPRVDNYGWLNNESLNNFGQEQDHNFSLSLNSNDVGFYGNSLFFDNIPKNASDEIKSGYHTQDDDLVSHISSPTPISIPTATEELSDNSDENEILDVQSIEQDAKQDLPIFDEYIIEPSETDDDKMECRERKKSSEESTFTDRIEIYNNIDNSNNFKIDSEHEGIGSVLVTSPAVTIASYFDTGNYAADTHYKNSLTMMRIPPGFEEEYHKRLSGIMIKDNILTENKITKNHDGFIYVPETTTQTNPLQTLSFTSANTSCITNNMFSNAQIKTSPVSSTEQNIPLPSFPSVFGNEICISTSSSDIMYHDQKQTEPVTLTTNQFWSDSKDPPTSSIVKPNTIQEKIDLTSLPEPSSFFSSPETKNSDEKENTSNRLASYFMTPAKSDHAKSFFELSQSQNHYKHNINISNNEPKINDKENKYIPTDKNIANMNLVRELALNNNSEFSPSEHIVRTVNYFTVEFDNPELNIDKITKMSSKDCINKFANVKLENTEKDHEETSDDNNIILSLNNCKYCCNFQIAHVKNNRLDISNTHKVKKNMDSNTNTKKDCSTNIDTGKDENTMSVNINMDNVTKDDFNENVAIVTENRVVGEYTPVKFHWFYRIDKDAKIIWRGFSYADSTALEEAYNSPDLNENTLVATDGGRYDVNIIGRIRIAVYWAEKPTNVMRCSWFYKAPTDYYMPYEENVAEKLETEYRHGITTGEWHRRICLPYNESVVMHTPAVMVHLTSNTDGFASSALFVFTKRVYRNLPKIILPSDQNQKIDHLLMVVHGAGERGFKKKQTSSRPRVIRREVDESEIEDNESADIDHLLLLCHGVGSACDMRMRPVELVVDDFRKTSLQLIQSHYRNSCGKGTVGRVEILPISWHDPLHSGPRGVDKRLAKVTLDSIPLLRGFTNDTVLDVLLYTSPIYCQRIIDTVCSELNRIYSLFLSRNPGYGNGVSIGGHSLGSVILYDLLCHQPDQSSKDKQYVRGNAGTGQPTVKFPKLDFSPDAMYALGSPIAIFECIRGVESLGEQFSLPTCKRFLNIFHPYDPIAYRIEPLINADLQHVKPYLIPHHKGRKRMHLELKETMARVSADIKQRLIESMKTTWLSMWRTPTPAIETQLEKVVEEELEKEQLTDDTKTDVQTFYLTPTTDQLGLLNGGRRIDYVLQEAPFEIINEYLFAMKSHVGYWESEDTMLLILREIYNSFGIQPDSVVPQQSLTIERTRNEESNMTGSSENPSTSRGST